MGEACKAGGQHLGGSGAPPHRHIRAVPHGLMAAPLVCGAAVHARVNLLVDSAMARMERWTSPGSLPGGSLPLGRLPLLTAFHIQLALYRSLAASGGGSRPLFSYQLHLRVSLPLNKPSVMIELYYVYTIYVTV